MQHLHLTRGWVCRLQLQPVLASAVILRSESRGTHDHILLSQFRDSSNREGQVPVFISPRNRVVRLYAQALGSLFVVSYGSQGYGGVIRPCLHTRLTGNGSWPSLYIWAPTAQKTPVPTALLLLHTCLLRPSRDGY
jgi:hypothetical protein